MNSKKETSATDIKDSSFKSRKFLLTIVCLLFITGVTLTGIWFSTIVSLLPVYVGSILGILSLYCGGNVANKFVVGGNIVKLQQANQPEQPEEEEEGE